MTANIGQAQQFTFSSATYTASGNCLQTGGLDDAVSQITYLCGATEKAIDGPRSSTFNFSMVVQDSDHAIKTNLAPGATATDFAAYPNGTTTGRIKISSTDTVVLTSNINWGVDSLITIDGSIKLNQITIGGAT